MQLHLLVSLALPIATSALSSSLGCFSKAPGLTSVKQYTFQSQDYCLRQCNDAGYEIAILKDGVSCGCSHTAPDASDKVDKDECNSACAGYPSDYCGGKNVYTVLTTDHYVPDEDSGASTSASLRTTYGGIVVAPTSASPTPATLTKATATATQGVMTHGITALPSASKSVAGITALHGASSAAASSTPSVTPNAAESLRAGSIAGSFLAGLALLL